MLIFTYHINELKDKMLLTSQLDVHETNLFLKMPRNNTKEDIFYSDTKEDIIFSCQPGDFSMYLPSLEQETVFNLFKRQNYFKWHHFYYSQMAEAFFSNNIV